MPPRTRQQRNASRRRAVSPVPWTVAVLLLIIAGLVISIAVVARQDARAEEATSPSVPTTAPASEGWRSVFKSPAMSGDLSAGPLQIARGRVRIVVSADGPGAISVAWGPEGSTKVLWSADDASAGADKLLDFAVDDGAYMLVVDADPAVTHSVELFVTDE